MRDRKEFFGRVRTKIGQDQKSRLSKHYSGSAQVGGSKLPLSWRRAMKK